MWSERPNPSRHRTDDTRRTTWTDDRDPSGNTEGHSTHPACITVSNRTGGVYPLDRWQRQTTPPDPDIKGLCLPRDPDIKGLCLPRDPDIKGLCLPRGPDIKGTLPAQEKGRTEHSSPPDLPNGSLLQQGDRFKRKKKEWLNLLKNPRYFDTRMDDFVSVRKNSNKRLKTLSGNTNATENVSADTITSSSASKKVADEGEPKCSGSKELRGSIRSSIDVGSTQPSSTITKCSGNTFRSVTELSSGGKKLSGISFDMDRAFKELAGAAPTNISAPAESLDGHTNPAAAKFCSEFHVPGQNIPLDFTLKSGMRVVSSSSVNWFHRLMNCGTLDGSISTKPLYSWVHPQCSLPNSVITALTSSMKEEGQTDFLSKRQLAWETSFRSLYVMLRKNVSSIFYVCTRQFVAMFTSGAGSMEDTGVCNAYISQSSRTLRSLLKEQDVCFTMPLCRSKVEQDTAEDLIELSEIERHSVGMSKRKISVSDVDNSPESLLAFTGNINVHGLYDFLLNYRFFLTSLTSYDVPLLYSPVPFENAALSAPEVKCKEVRSIDNLHVQLQESSTTSEQSTCSIKIKDAYLPPWIIRSVCDALASNGGDFEASFTTEPMSVGLNVVIDMVCQRYDDKAATTDEGLHEKHSTFGITNTVLSPHLSHAFLNRIKFSDSSYTAYLSPV